MFAKNDIAKQHACVRHHQPAHLDLCCTHSHQGRPLNYLGCFSCKCNVNGTENKEPKIERRSKDQRPTTKTKICYKNEGPYKNKDQYMYRVNEDPFLLMDE